MFEAPMTRLWREHAEEARAHAAQMTDAQAKAALINIAQSYERLVEIAERRISELLHSN